MCNQDTKLSPIWLGYPTELRKNTSQRKRIVGKYLEALDKACVAASIIVLFLFVFGLIFFLDRWEKIRISCIVVTMFPKVSGCFIRFCFQLLDKLVPPLLTCMKSTRKRIFQIILIKHQLEKLQVNLKSQQRSWPFIYTFLYFSANIIVESTPATKNKFLFSSSYINLK